MGENKVRVLYVAGAGRSGTTLLLHMLAQVTGGISVGKLAFIWKDSFAQNTLCGCGQPFQEYPFWMGVVKEAFGSHQHVDVDRILALQRSLQGFRYLPILALPFLRTTKYKEKIRAYADVLQPLYQSIHNASGGGLIIDSSKKSVVCICA